MMTSSAHHICSPRRHAFYNPSYDFPGFCLVFRRNQQRLPAMRGLTVDANLVFPESREEHVSPESVFAGPDFDSAASKFPLRFIADFPRSRKVLLLGRRERRGKPLHDS